MLLFFLRLQKSSRKGPHWLMWPVMEIQIMKSNQHLRISGWELIAMATFSEGNFYKKIRFTWLVLTMKIYSTVKQLSAEFQSYLLPNYLEVALNMYVYCLFHWKLLLLKNLWLMEGASSSFEGSPDTGCLPGKIYNFFHSINHLARHSYDNHSI